MATIASREEEKMILMDEVLDALEQELELVTTILSIYFNLSFVFFVN